MTRAELNSRQRRSNIKSSSRNTRERNKTSRNNDDIVTKIIVGPYDYIILITVTLLVLFGVIMVFSASYYTTGNSKIYGYDMYYFLKKHAVFAFIGFCAMALANNFNYERWKRLSFSIYITANILLVLVLFIGTKVNGKRRWLFGFQPSEVAKIALILFLSYYISKNKGILKTWTGFFKCSFVVIIPTALIALQNMSTAIVTAVVGFSIIFVASPKIRYFIVAGIGSVAAGTAMIYMERFRMKRLLAWRDPFAYAKDAGYQIIQSLYAIASGGLFGLGLGQSRQKLGYIPEGHNDIIFAIICEELGLFGASILILLFIIFIWRGIKTAMHSINLFGSLVATGITVMIAIQVIINIAVVTNTIPNTGIPMPFISYGGTSLLIMMGAIGILLNISRYYKE